jgi:mono/diheme cytochrome c family protein
MARTHAIALALAIPMVLPVVLLLARSDGASRFATSNLRSAACAATGQSKAERAYVGFQNCLRCHNSGIDGEVELPGGGKLSLMKEQWVLYKEYPIWAKQDKHGQAYTVLLNEHSKNIGKLLNVKEIHRDQRCLACHTGFPLNQMPVEKDGLVDRDLAKNLDINLGVSCEGCHGPSGDYKSDKGVVFKGWNKPHQEAPALPYEKTEPWRFLAPSKKQSEFGFFDVRSPSSKTKLCVSCHIGDVEQGRIVTHEMFAAGHPPLPGFEIETFTQQMPKHWADFSAKSAQVQDLFLAHTQDPLYTDTNYKKDGLQRTRSLLTGALIAAGEYLRFTEQLAAGDLIVPVTRPAWPELAAFDCYACHHDLKSPSRRQERKAGRVPGRPALQDWPFVLAKIAVKHLGGVPADCDAKLADLRRALEKQPFGDPKAVVQSCHTASAWFRTKGLEMEKKQLSRADGIALLTEISSAAAAETIDYDSARQLVWAFNVIDTDLRGNYPNAKKAQDLLEPLGKEMFLLDLRTGRNASTAVPGDVKARTTTEVNLETVFGFVVRYEPAEFQRKLKTVAGLLKPMAGK